MSTILLLLGVLAASQVNSVAAGLAMAVAILAVLYDYWGKHQYYFGPINMGMCRAGNLLLGISVAPELIHSPISLIGVVPLIYVAAITMISRGEVHGENRKALYLGGLMYAFITLLIFATSYLYSPDYWQTIIFLIGLDFMIFPPLIKAIRTQDPKLIGKSVKAAVISLIILNASLAVAFAGWKIGVIVLLLLPVSLWLAKKFAVT
jgi:4-hydroxybenzoate polyprenyltransferase